MSVRWHGPTRPPPDGIAMAENQVLLPLLAVDDRVILPHMSVPVATESEEAWAAINASRETDGLLLLVPRIDGRYASVGTIAHVEETGRLPDGREASVIRGLYRGILNGAAVEREGALWITVEPAPDPELAALPAGTRSLDREYRGVLENLLEVRQLSGLMRTLRRIQHPGELADLAGYSPDLTLAQLAEVLEERAVDVRLQKLIAWTKEILAD